MWLKPFSLLQLETEAKAFPFKQLRGINGVGGKQTSVFGDKYAAGATVGRTTTQISTGRKPGDVGRVLQEHRVSTDGCKKRSNTFLLFFDIGQTALVLNQTTTAGCIIHAARAH